MLFYIPNLFWCSYFSFTILLSLVGTVPVAIMPVPCTRPSPTLCMPFARVTLLRAFLRSHFYSLFILVVYFILLTFIPFIVLLIVYFEHTFYVEFITIWFSVLLLGVVACRTLLPPTFWPTRCLFYCSTKLPIVGDCLTYAFSGLARWTHCPYLPCHHLLYALTHLVWSGCCSCYPTLLIVVVRLVPGRFVTTMVPSSGSPATTAFTLPPFLHRYGSVDVLLLYSLCWTPLRVAITHAFYPLHSVLNWRWPPTGIYLLFYWCCLYLLRSTCRCYLPFTFNIILYIFFSAFWTVVLFVIFYYRQYIGLLRCRMVVVAVDCSVLLFPPFAFAWFDIDDGVAAYTLLPTTTWYVFLLTTLLPSFIVCWFLPIWC